MDSRAGMLFKQVLEKHFKVLKEEENRVLKTIDTNANIEKKLLAMTPSEHLQRHLELLNSKGSGKGKAAVAPPATVPDSEIRINHHAIYRGLSVTGPAFDTRTCISDVGTLRSDPRTV